MSDVEVAEFSRNASTEFIVSTFWVLVGGKRMPDCKLRLVSHHWEIRDADTDTSNRDDINYIL